jgi:hypothetical protein
MQPWLEFLDWLREWQFLVGSGIVLLAAALTVRAINRQIKQRHFEIEDRRNRLVQALRTSLHLRTKETLPFARGEAEKVVIAFGPPKVLAALKELDIDSVISPEAREHCVRFLSGEKAHGAAVILQRKLKMAS